MTASLRPFPTKAEADAAVADIRARGRLIVGLDIGSNLFSFRDPITGEITGFDVDIAGEIAPTSSGPSQVEYRILSSAERVSALQRSAVDIVVKTMTITCERRKLVNFLTVYFKAKQRILAPRESPIAKPPTVRQAGVRGSGHDLAGPDPGDRADAGHRVSGELGGLPGGDSAARNRRGQHRRLDPGRLGGGRPVSAIVGPNMAAEPYGIGINLNNTGLVRFVNGTLERIRRDGTWNTLYRKWLTVLGPAPAPPTPRYLD